MKAIRFAAVLMLCAATFVISVAAQGTRPAPATTPAITAPRTTPASNEPVPAAKIALVDTGAFYDEKAGIAKFVAGLRQLQNEFRPKEQELQGLQTRINTLADEIQKLSGTPAVAETTIRAKQEEGERLARELEYKKKDAEASVQRRRAEIMGPISEEIAKSLQAFADSKGITMILDASQMNNILAFTKAVDVTQAFIAEFNAKNPVAAATPR